MIIQVDPALLFSNDQQIQGIGGDISSLVKDWMGVTQGVSSCGGQFAPNVSVSPSTTTNPSAQANASPSTASATNSYDAYYNVPTDSQWTLNSSRACASSNYCSWDRLSSRDGSHELQQSHGCIL